MTMTETVWRQVREQLGDSGKIEVLVGIPTFNNAKTVESVVTSRKGGHKQGVPQRLCLGGECGCRITGRHTRD